MSATTHALTIQKSFDVAPRCIATDYDGTFASEIDHAPTEQSKAMYKELRDRNVPVIFATGRPVYGLRRVVMTKAPDLLPAFKPCPGVYSHGAVVFGESELEIVDCKLFGEAEMLYACDKFYQIKAGLMNLGVLDKSNPEFVVCCYGIHRLTIDYDTPLYWQFDAKCAEGTERAFGCRLDDEKVFRNIAPTATHLAVTAPPDVLRKVWDALDEKELAEKAGARKVIPSPYQVHLVRLDVDKGAALKTLCAKYNYDRRDTMCLGDGMNDIEMLAWAETSVAMGNASESVKKYAKFVTAKSSQEGWPQAITRHTQLLAD